jgi:hypothetical protein
MGLPRCYPEVFDVLLDLTCGAAAIKRNDAAARSSRLSDVMRRMTGKGRRKR